MQSQGFVVRQSKASPDPWLHDRVGSVMALIRACNPEPEAPGTLSRLSWQSGGCSR